jgi:hypothetical protein
MWYKDRFSWARSLKQTNPNKETGKEAGALERDILCHRREKEKMALSDK